MIEGATPPFLTPSHMEEPSPNVHAKNFKNAIKLGFQAGLGNNRKMVSLTPSLWTYDGENFLAITYNVDNTNYYPKYESVK